MENNDTKQRAILYICGYLGNGVNSGTYRWLDANFGNSNKLLCVNPNNRPINEALDEVKKIIAECNPIIISNSFGCFVSSCFSQPTVWINPCLYPSIVLPTLNPEIPTTYIDDLRAHEAMRKKAFGVRNNFFPVTSDSDEIIDDYHLPDFTTVCPVIVPNGKHKLTDVQRTEYVKPVIEKVIHYYPIKVG